MENKTFVVIGAYGGVGQALCAELQAQSANLVLMGKDSEKLGPLAEQYGATACPGDASDMEAVQNTVNAAVEKHGQVDGIANLAGSVLLKPAHLTSDEEFQQTLTTNLTTSFNVLRAGVKAMTKTGGSLVFVSTAAAEIGIPNHEAIAAAKAGVVGLARSAASTYAQKGIRVNCVAPGLTATPLTERITQNESALKASLAMHALGKVGQPEDIASAIGWFLDPKNSWVTGQVLAVDGGLSSLRTRN